MTEIWAQMIDLWVLTSSLCTRIQDLRVGKCADVYLVQVLAGRTGSEAAVTAASDATTELAAAAAAIALEPTTAAAAAAAIAFEPGAAAAATQGMTLVHFSAQLERCLWDRGCA